MELRSTYQFPFLTSVLGVSLDFNDVPLDYTKETYSTYNGILELISPKVDIRRISFRNIGTFGQFLIPIWEKLQITLGARVDFNNYYGNVFTPRVGLVGTITENLTLKLLYGTAFRAPTAREMYSTWVGQADRISNPDLKPEKLQSFETSIIYDFRKKMSFEISAFQNYATDVIFSNVDIGNGKTQNQNLGKMNIYGCETRIATQFFKGFYAFGSISYQKG